MKSAQRQFLVSVATVGDYYASKSGGAVSADVSDVYDGGRLTPEKLASPATIEDITVSRPYDQQRDAPVIARLQRLVGRWRTTIVVQPTDADLVPIGSPTTYSNALLTGLTPPEHDASSGDAATYELTFAVESVS